MSILSAMQIAGNIVQGVAGWRAGQETASALDAAAAGTLRQGSAQEADVRYQARQAIGAQSAAQWSNGFLGGTGSALDALHESQVNAALDALRIRRASMDKANSYTFQAKMAREKSWFDLASGLLGAGATAQQQRVDWANARRAQLHGSAQQTIAENPGIF